MHTNTLNDSKKNYHLQLVIMMVTSLNTLSEYNFNQPQRNLALMFAVMMMIMTMMTAAAVAMTSSYYVQ